MSSSRRSGTKQQSAGRCLTANSIIESVTAISRFTRVCTRAQQDFDVARLDVAPVLAQVHGDAVGARLLGDQRRRHGIGIARVARLAQGRDVIDVDA